MVEAAQAVVIDTVTQLRTHARQTVTRACRLVGLPRATYYRIHRGYRHYTPVPAPIPHTSRVQPAALTQAERDQVCAVLADQDYEDLSVGQTYWRAFDAGQISCSQRTFYRIATAHQLVGDRRRTRRYGHNASSRRTPAAAATRPGQLWSWDATELKGPGRQRYKLMLIIDVYSRYPIGWKIEYTESYAHAIDLFSTAIDHHGIPDTVHADNGPVMRSHDLVNLLHTNGVVASYSRPRVSNDNPFSESMFKTIKYDLACPDRFDDIHHARAWTRNFLHRYATQHRHSSIGHYTPSAVHHGTAETDRARRQAQLDHYWQRHPERFRRQPQAPTIKPTGINTNQLTQVSQPG